ncbi:hypothetical protein [Chryseobacterium sp. MYb328]|uniref:hypothetical protein n=1 Tax=Chryseobacterium sp. MYb328 TaxID=2745231 RepID=UPI0030A395F8
MKTPSQKHDYLRILFLVLFLLGLTLFGLVEDSLKILYIASPFILPYIFVVIYEGVVDYYMGEYSDNEAFAQYLLEMDIPESLPNYIYIDWETTARNLMFDYFESNGHYFKS